MVKTNIQASTADTRRLKMQDEQLFLKFFPLLCIPKQPLHLGVEAVYQLSKLAYLKSGVCLREQSDHLLLDPLHKPVKTLELQGVKHPLFRR